MRRLVDRVSCLSLEIDISEPTFSSMHAALGYLKSLSRRTADLFQLSLLLLFGDSPTPFELLPSAVSRPSLQVAEYFRAAWLFYLSI